MNNEIKLNKNQEEYINNLKHIIEQTSNDIDNDEKEEDIKYLKNEITLAIDRQHTASRQFEYAVSALHNATEEGSYTMGINEDMEVAIKELKKADKRLAQAKAFYRTVSRLVHQKLEAMGVED